MVSIQRDKCTNAYTAKDISVNNASHYQGVYTVSI